MTQTISGTLGEVLKQAIDARIPLSAKVQLLWESEEQSWPIDPQSAEAITYLQERLKNALTDPEKIREADAELDELHENLNRNRIEAGERPLFPE